MARTTSPARQNRYERVQMQHEPAEPEAVKALKGLCERLGRPMLAEPLTRQRVIAYTNALNRRKD